MNDSIVLSGIGFVLVTLLGIAGFFVKRWMDKTEEIDLRSSDLVEKTNLALQDLNITMTNINNNLLMYQVKGDSTIDKIKNNILDHKNIYLREKKVVDKLLNDHGGDIQDHEIRIRIIEKDKT